MDSIKRLIRLSLLALIIAAAAGCSRRPPSGPTPLPATVAPTEAPTTVPANQTPTAEATPSSTPTATVEPITDADIDDAMDVVKRFLAALSRGEFRDVYGSLLTTAGQQQLAELVLGRLALSNPHISYFEVLGAEPVDGRVAVDVTWDETFDGQGKVGTQKARILLARQDDGFLVDDIALEEYQPAATPVPPPLPKAEALTTPAAAGQEMRFRASGFQSGETVMVWLELPDGRLVAPGFETTDGAGSLEKAYSGDVTQGLEPGRWIWWAQALRDSTRNTGITFEVQSAPTPEPTPTTAPTQPRPTPAQVQASPTRPPATATAVAAPPTATPQPSTGYPAPTILWPEPETSRNYGSALVVEFVPVAEELAPDEFYQLVIEARDGNGVIFHGGSLVGKGDACSGQYDQACRSITADARFMRPFHLSGVEARAAYYVQVVRQSGDQFTPISPASEPHVVVLKSAPDEG